MPEAVTMPEAVSPTPARTHPRASGGRSTAGRSRLGEVARYVILTVALLFFVGPVLLILSASLRSSVEVAMDPLGWPTNPSLDSYKAAWDAGQFSDFALNTVIYTVTSCVGVVICGTLAGYGFARLRFAGNGLLLSIIILGMIVPLQAYMIPLYFQLLRLGLLGTYWAVILPSIAMGVPFATFLMRAFFLNLPNELAEAARLDGCGHWRIFRHIMLPLAAPAVATLIIVQSVTTWNAYLLPLLAAPEGGKQPLALGLQFFQGEFNTDRALISAATMITSIPMIILVIVFQRRFISGLTAGAVRG